MSDAVVDRASEPWGADLQAGVMSCLTNATDLPGLSSCLMPVLTQAFDADRGSFFVLDSDHMCLRSIVADGVNHTLVVPLRIGLVGACILLRQSLTVDDAYQHPYFNPDIDAALGFQTRSLLVAPMLSSTGATLGCMELINKQQGGFSALDTERACAAAARIARWIETDSIYPAGVEAEAMATRRIIGCERASVFAVDTRHSHIKALYADGDEGRLLSLNMKLGIAGMVAISGRSVMLDDAWDDSRFDRSVDARTGYRTRSMLCVPLLSDTGNSCGVIQLINQASGVFSAEQLAVLESLASAISRSVERFQYKEIQ